MSNQSTVNTPKSIAALIEDVSEEATRRTQSSVDTDVMRHFTVGKNQVFAVHKSEQHQLDFSRVKSEIFKAMNLPPNESFLQVVGDSARFSLEGTEFARKFLEAKLSWKRPLLWGYTGKGKKGDSTFGVNQLVNNWIDEDPSRAERTMANVVSHHTPIALEDWGCNIAASNTNFFLVYGDARFGDDIVSSDTLCGAFVCIEGGIQSFSQLVNGLAKKKPVCGVFNIRGKNNPGCLIPETREYGTFFSAGEFFAMLKDLKNQKGDDFSASDVEAAKESYFKTHLLFNHHNKDASTKQALFDAAWKKFMENEVWKNVHLCDFVKFQPTMFSKVATNKFGDHCYTPASDGEYHLEEVIAAKYFSIQNPGKLKIPGTFLRVYNEVPYLVSKELCQSVGREDDPFKCAAVIVRAEIEGAKYFIFLDDGKGWWIPPHGTVYDGNDSKYAALRRLATKLGVVGIPETELMHMGSYAFTAGNCLVGPHKWECSVAQFFLDLDYEQVKFLIPDSVELARDEVTVIPVTKYPFHLDITKKVMFIPESCVASAPLEIEEKSFGGHHRESLLRVTGEKPADPAWNDYSYLNEYNIYYDPDQ